MCSRMNYTCNYSMTHTGLDERSQHGTSDLLLTSVGKPWAAAERQAGRPAGRQAEIPLYHLCSTIQQHSCSRENNSGRGDNTDQHTHTQQAVTKKLQFIFFPLDRPPHYLSAPSSSSSPQLTGGPVLCSSGSTEEPPAPRGPTGLRAAPLVSFGIIQLASHSTPAGRSTPSMPRVGFPVLMRESC